MAHDIGAFLNAVKDGPPGFHDVRQGFCEVCRHRDRVAAPGCGLLHADDAVNGGQELAQLFAVLGAGAQHPVPSAQRYG
jgi:hypothetical protein